MSSVELRAEDLARPLPRKLGVSGGMPLLALGATILVLAFAAQHDATRRNPVADPARVIARPFPGPVVATALRAAHLQIATSLASPTAARLATRSTGPCRLARKRPLELAAALRGASRHRIAHATGRVAFVTAWAALDGIEAIAAQHDTAGAPADADGTVEASAADLGWSTYPATARRAAAPTLLGGQNFRGDVGHIQPLARAGLLNGQPAASVGLQYDLPDGIRVDAAGVTDMASMAAPTSVKKTFKVSTIASIPLD